MRYALLIAASTLSVFTAAAPVSDPIFRAGGRVKREPSVHGKESRSVVDRIIAIREDDHVDTLHSDQISSIAEVDIEVRSADPIHRAANSKREAEPINRINGREPSVRGKESRSADPINRNPDSKREPIHRAANSKREAEPIDRINGREPSVRGKESRSADPINRNPDSKREPIHRAGNSKREAEPINRINGREPEPVNRINGREPEPLDLQNARDVDENDEEDSKAPSSVRPPGNGSSCIPSQSMNHCGINGRTPDNDQDVEIESDESLSERSAEAEPEPFGRAGAGRRTPAPKRVPGGVRGSN